MLFAQTVSGSEPSPVETSERNGNFMFPQSAIFADIQFWNLTQAWLLQCCHKDQYNWVEEYSVTDQWEEDRSSSSNWANSDIPPIKHVSC